MDFPKYLYDIYLIRTSGLPIFAGCTGSDYCEAHQGQHMLHSGFFTAMYAFSKETFGDTKLESMLYDKIQLNFKVDVSTGLMLIFIHPISIEKETIHDQLDTAFHIYKQKYHHRIGPDEFSQSLFKEFKQDLEIEGIIPSSSLYPTKEYLLPHKKVFQKIEEALL